MRTRVPANSKDEAIDKFCSVWDIDKSKVVAKKSNDYIVEVKE